MDQIGLRLLRSDIFIAKIAIMVMSGIQNTVGKPKIFKQFFDYFEKYVRLETKRTKGKAAWPLVWQMARSKTNQMEIGKKLISWGALVDYDFEYVPPEYLGGHWGGGVRERANTYGDFFL